jgi:hypothetical protein
MAQGEARAGARSIAVLRDRFYTARNKTYVRLLGGMMPFYLVNEYPKSGGTWLTQMLAEAMDIPFRRNELVRLERSLVHGHYLHPTLLRNVVVIWRDPRDLLVSFYHHCYFVVEFHDRKFGNKQLVSLMRERCPVADYDDVAGNLPRFIRFISTTPVAPRFTWPEFAAVWANRPGTVQTSYESLRADTPGELTRIVRALGGLALDPDRAGRIAEAHSFDRAKAKAEAELPAGAERSFVREGSLGGWRRHFGDEALAELARHGYGAPLAALGYQP